MKYIIHSRIGLLVANPNEVDLLAVDTCLISTGKKIAEAVHNILRKHGYSNDQIGYIPEIGITILDHEGGD